MFFIVYMLIIQKSETRKEKANFGPFHSTFTLVDSLLRFHSFSLPHVIPPAGIRTIIYPVLSVCSMVYLNYYLLNLTQYLLLRIFISDSFTWSCFIPLLLFVNPFYFVEIIPINLPLWLCFFFSFFFGHVYMVCGILVSNQELNLYPAV